MPRRYRPEKRVAEPDPKFGDRQVQSFINRVMKHGKKSTARRIVYDAIAIMEENTHRQFALATRWIVAATRARSGNSFAEKLAGEMIEASNHQGSAYRKREEAHRMAEANRAFSHYRL